MKNKRNVWCIIAIIVAVAFNCALKAQQKTKVANAAELKEIIISEAPKGIVRTIKQDRKGAIWVTSWEGVYKYDGKTFTNVTSKVSSARFFSVLEDKKGNLWFASIGSGVYLYDGKSFQNFTTQDGLLNDRVTNIYEDKTGTIWFGTEGGVSRYDGKSFRNLKMREQPPIVSADSVYTGPAVKRNTNDSVPISSFQRPPEHWTHNDVNAIVEDKTGKFWLGTRGYAVTYDGKSFTTVTNKEGKPFTNVRSIIKDQKGNIWLGGHDGLWRFDGNTFTNFSQNFVGYVYEDKKGNIWTSSESAEKSGWLLSWYDEKTLSDKKPKVITIINKSMIFGILEDKKGNIWFGDLEGVYRYDGKTITDFKSKDH